MSTNFDKIKEFHKTFELHIGSKIDDELFNNEKEFKLRLALIQEEFNELIDAITDKNIKEVADAVIDILYVTYGAAASFGIDANKGFDLVHKSNMTKACLTEEEAIATVENYKNDTRYDSPAYKKSGDYYIVYNKSSGKILKSINYKPVDQDALIQ
jgi:predicted HAD superfamily Cof-like phosphohydrolase